MVQTIQAKDIDLRYLIDNFGIQLVTDEQYFRELLDKVKAGYFIPIAKDRIPQKIR